MFVAIALFIKYNKYIRKNGGIKNKIKNRIRNTVTFAANQAFDLFEEQAKKILLSSLCKTDGFENIKEAIVLTY